MAGRVWSTAESLRRWFRPPRRLRFARSGAAFTGGALLLGVAAIGTGNNLLFLLLGAMLGFITLSGWLSEQMLRGVVVRRRPPRAITAGSVARLTYELHNGKRRLPSFAVEVGEAGAPERGWVASIEPGGDGVARADARWERRGVYPLATVTLATSFPFGLFRKERDVEIPGEIVVWPRTDRPVREPRPAGEARARSDGQRHAGAAGARGEFRALRPFRPGDDPRDIHWRTTARAGSPILREYERDRARALWLCLDLRAAEDDEGTEILVEATAALAAAAARRGDAFGLAAGDARLPPANGSGQLERVLDALARIRFRPGAPPTPLPAAPGECVWVTDSVAGVA